MRDDPNAETAPPGSDASDAGVGAWFALFNEIGIVAQLSRASFEARLPEGLILPHFSVVNHLVRLGDGVTPMHLARAFQVPKTTMTHTLGGLERHGYVTLGPNPRDGRSKIVALTPAGRAFREAAVAGIGPDVAALIAAMPDFDPGALLPELARLRATLDAMRD